MAPALVVAKIEKDHLANGQHEDWVAGHEGKEFHYDAMVEWWGWAYPISIDTAPKVEFRLYDDDNNLYYSGWLFDDDESIVQQFVLGWAEADSGCTVLYVNRPVVGWTQEIG